MYTDKSSNENYPKTLLIRNTPDGCVWQLYHVQKQSEAEKLADNATKNGFYGITLEDYQPDYEETWSDWRETTGGKAIISFYHH